MFKLGKALAVCLTIATAAICTGAYAAGPEKPTIGAVLYTRDSQWWQQMEKGMKDAAAKYDVNLQIALSRRQLPTEAQVLDDLTTRGVKAIIISPLDKDASAAAVRQAKSRGIDIVEYNTFFSDRNIASHSIGVDNRELAALVGRQIDKAIKADYSGHAKVGLIPLPAINPGSGVRKGGVMSALTDVKVDVVSTIEAATPEQGADAAQNILQRDPGTQMIWASNSGALSGAASEIARSGGKVQLYGIDMSAELARAMLDPKSNIEAVSDQQPYKLGYYALEVAVKDLRGEKSPRDIQVPVRCYSRSDPASLKEYLKLTDSLSN